MRKDTTKCEIYTDGSGRKQDYGACGLCIIEQPSGVVTNLCGGYHTPGTNNTAELNAIIMALRIALKYSDLDIEFKILSDSEYSINSIKGIYNGNANSSLIDVGRELYEEYDGELSWVKAHSGIVGNENADKNATLAKEEKVVKWKKI